MTTTTTTSTSWFSRLGDSFKNILLGFLFVVGAGVLLFWNEGRAVHTEQSLKEGQSAVVSVSIDKKDPKNEGKLIHFSGQATVPSVLADGEFGVSGASLKMKRIVEVYQWQEDAKSKTVEKLGGGTETTTTYSYVKIWSDALIDSSRFKEADLHQNPVQKRFENKEWIADGIKVGAFSISEDMVSSLSGYQPLPITQAMLDAQNSTSPAELKLVGNTIYYKTNDVTLPEIGSTRIHFENITPQDISIIYKQSGGSLVTYTTKNGSSIAMIKLGISSAEEMFKNAEESNKTMTWILRLVGVLLMSVGFQMILGVLPVLGSVIPFIGHIIGAGVGLVSFLLTLIFSSIIIAIAWIAYRPLIGLALLAVAASGYIFLMKKRQK
jgi:hypothetical protein